MEDLRTRLGVRPTVQLLSPSTSPPAHPPPPPASLCLADLQSLSWVQARKLPSKFKSPNQDLTPKGAWPRESTSARASWRTPP